MQQTPPAYLIIRLGNRWTDILRLQPEQPVSVGRSSECQIVVRDESVSRKHATIEHSEAGWMVTDLGSRNGTLVDETRIENSHRLTEGETIQVGGCRMTYATQLSQAFGGDGVPAESPQLTQQLTQEVPPTIVGRLSDSQWSIPRSAAPAASQPQAGHRWGFFYRLVSELVGADSNETASGVALDRLLELLQIHSGAVVAFSQAIESGQPAKTELPAMAVLATRQAPGSSYHRVSDFLATTVARQGQAVLARNVQDDPNLSVARASGQHDIGSVICAPIRTTSGSRLQTQESQSQQGATGRIIGLVHLYSTAGEPMLANEDLELVVGVADNLAIALSRIEENRQLAKDLQSTRRRADQLQQQLAQTTVMVGKSQSLERVRVAIERAGPTDATVLVRGESGVGKELVARGIHAQSRRQAGPLVCMNCAALAPTLLESELFGHEKGAFTGATERKIGKFEAAHGGTLLLDEIGEMSPELQAKFLRVLEGQPFERLGGNKPIVTDVRVIAATNRNLETAVEAQEFRSDLYYRLRVIEIEIPPLRERREDVPLLVEHFLAQLKVHAGRRFQGISPAALERLSRHHWPGNVRELRNVLERAVVLGGGPVIEPEDLSISSLGGAPAAAAGPAATAHSTFHPIPLADLEEAHIRAMLEHTENNKTQAAKLLGIERSTLDRKLKRYQAQLDRKSEV